MWQSICVTKSVGMLKGCKVKHNITQKKERRLSLPRDDSR